MQCGDLTDRQQFQEQLAALNPEAAEAVLKMARAGPDAEAARQRSLRVGAGERDDKVRDTLVLQSDTAKHRLSKWPFPHASKGMTVLREAPEI